MVNLELLIKQDLDKGMGILSVAKKYKVGTSKVQKIIKQGRYYLDIKTGEIIFTAKKISFEEQAFNYICFKYGVENGYLYALSGSKIIQTRSANPRLAVYIGVNSSQTHRWSKKDMRLFEVNEQGEVIESLEDYAVEFELTEKDKFKETQYYIDDNGMVKGYRLSYITLSRYHLKHIKKYALFYIEYRNSLTQILKENKRQFYLMCKIKFEDDDAKFMYINTTIGIELGRWILAMGEKYKYEYILKSINHACNNDITDPYYLEVPKYFYINKRAYYSDLLSEEYKEMVAEYLY